MTGLMPNQTNRREFLRASAVASTGLATGAIADAASRQPREEHEHPHDTAEYPRDHAGSG